MTVILNIIGNGFTIHTSDSLRTVTANAGLDQTTQSTISPTAKIVRFSQFRGAMSVFGLMHLNGWDIIEWLEQEASRAVERNLWSAMRFANYIESRLRDIFFGFNVRRHSVGIHFTAYERVNQQWVPELFFITNFRGIQGDTFRYVGGLELASQRQTFFTLTQRTDFRSHGRRNIRANVAANLTNGNMFIYKNGDPSVFQDNHRQFLPELVAEFSRENSNDLSTFLAQIALAEVQALIRLHEGFPEDIRAIGGRAHNLILNPDNEINPYQSITGIDLIPGA